MAFASHDDYFAQQPEAVRRLLEAIQAQVEMRLPQASRCISYNMPAYRQRRVFFHFAAFKRHIGIYPPVRQDAELIEVLAPYRGSKGNLAFPLAQSLPIDLIGRVAVALFREYDPPRAR